MKKFLISLLALGALAASTLSAQTKIVTVNMNEAFDRYYKAVSFKESMQSLGASLQEEVAAKRADLQAKAEAFEKLREELNNPMLSADAKKEKETEAQKALQDIRQQEQEFQRWAQGKEREFQRRGTELRGNLIKEIRDVVLVVGKEAGADLILDTTDLSGNGAPTVIYADSGLNITEKVIAEINKSAPTAAAKK